MMHAVSRTTVRQTALTIAAIGVGLVAITGQSLWMDEGSTVFKALIPSLADWWRMMLRLGGSDVQMPVYMFLVWCWQKLGIVSEYGLRMVNLPWLVIGTLALGRVRFWPLVFLTSPFVWYYAGELRPYAMQAAAGAVAASALLVLSETGDESRPWRGLHAAAFASLFLSACSLTGALWAVGLWVAVFCLKPGWLKSAGFWMRISPWIAAATAVGGYYLFTLLQGYRAAGSEGGLASMIFGFYELSGIMGLGPGRSELRANPSCLTGWLPVIIPAALCIGATWSRGMVLWVRETPKQTVMAIAAAVVIPLLMFAAVSVLKDFRVLGRHLSPMLPVVLLPIARCLRGGMAGNRIWKVLPCATIALWSVSAVMMRQMERHARDDYRSASVFMFQALRDGRKIWWQADMNATRYYAWRNGGMELVNTIQTLESEPPTGLMFADIVVINRPDLRFRGADYQSELKRNYFKPVARFTGFEIWSSN